jgi:hypothetical protein
MDYSAKKAAESYDNRRTEMLDKLEQLWALLESADADQRETPQHWTHAAELGHVNEKLDEVIEFMRSN